MPRLTREQLAVTQVTDIETGPGTIVTYGEARDPMGFVAVFSTRVEEEAALPLLARILAPGWEGFATPSPEGSYDAGLGMLRAHLSVARPELPAVDLSRPFASGQTPAPTVLGLFERVALQVRGLAGTGR